MEEAFNGNQWRLKQEKLLAALPELPRCISAIHNRVKPKSTYIAGICPNPYG